MTEKYPLPTFSFPKDIRRAQQEGLLSVEADVLTVRSRGETDGVSLCTTLFLSHTMMLKGFRHFDRESAYFKENCKDNWTKEAARSLLFSAISMDAAAYISAQMVRSPYDLSLIGGDKIKEEFTKIVGLYPPDYARHPEIIKFMSEREAIYPEEPLDKCLALLSPSAFMERLKPVLVRPDHSLHDFKCGV